MNFVPHLSIGMKYLLNIEHCYCSGCPNHHPVAVLKTKVLIPPAAMSVGG